MNADYLSLRKKISATFADIAHRQGSQMACKNGCNSCCLPGLSVSPVEFEFIKEYLARTPDLLTKFLSLELMNTQKKTRCSFLDEQGSCAIYEARPIICMSHGVPIKFKTGAQLDRSVCHLNFKDGLSELPESTFLNIDLINSILALINAKDYANQPLRRPLAPSSFK